MQRSFTFALVAGSFLAACASGTAPALTDDDDGDTTTGVGGSGTGTATTGTGGAPTTTGTGAMTTTSAGGMTTTGTGGTTTTTGVGGATTSSSSSSVSSSSSTGSGGGCTTTQILADTGFEGGTPNASWAESSTNFGTPLCTVTDCGMGGSSNPLHGGTWFAWFGGYAGGVEQAVLQQTITIPASAQTATLTYWLEAPICDALIDFGIFLDTNQLEYWTEPGGPSPYAGCGVTPNWTMMTIDLMAFADGVARTLSFEAIQDGSLALGPSNFMVDDVTVTVCN
jgi:hypothetical protein